MGLRELTVGRNDAGQRLDKFIAKAFRDLPVSLMYKALRKKDIRVNGKRAEASQIMNEGDAVRVYLPEDAVATGSPELEKKRLSHVTPSFSAVYEDENIVIINKPSGLSCHADSHNDVNNLTTQFRAYLMKKGEYSPEDETSFSPSLCNRIDRNTSGLVTAAKNAAALREADRIIRERLVTKKYLCAVHGEMKEKTGRLVNYIRKYADKSTVQVCGTPFPGGLEAITEYRVISVSGGLSLVEATLLTGRTHQIRAQFAAAGHPLLGDGKYGKNADDRRMGFSSQALVSCYLRFDAPDGMLSYLKGKEFTVPAEEIDFLRLF